MTEQVLHHISNSEIQSFKRCKRKWYLSYHLKLRKIQQNTTGALQLGTRIHEALAVMYATEPGDPIEAIRLQYEKARNECDPEDEITMNELNKEAELARIMIEGYVEWATDTGIDDDYEVLSSETELSAQFSDLPVILIGKLDTRVRRRSDSALLSMDHKTCASFDNLTKTLELTEQPLQYQLIERLTQPEDQWVVGGVLNMLRKVKRTASAKPPFYQRVAVHHSEVELRNFHNRLYGELTDMLRVENELNMGADHHVVAYPTPHGNCSWDCDFRAVCPLFEDGSRVDKALEASFQVHDPNERYAGEVSL